MSKPNQIRRLLRVGAISSLLVVTLIAASDLCVSHAARGKTTFNVDEVSRTQVGLVLGCADVLPNGRHNLYFKHRVDAAAELFHAGKVAYLIVSGANPTAEYDEPTAMKLALIERGVAAEKIVCDFAGLRTLDSIVRAKMVWGLDEVVVVSQEFHNKRAIAIGDKWGLKTSGYNAEGVRGPHSLKTDLREKLAVVKAMIDLYVLHTRPRFDGPPEAFFENV